MVTIDRLRRVTTNGAFSLDLNDLTLYDVPILMDARSQWALNRQRRLNILGTNRLRRQSRHFNCGINHAMRENGAHVSSCDLFTSRECVSIGDNLIQESFVTACDISHSNTTHTILHSTASVGGELETVSVSHVRTNVSRIQMMNKDFNFDSSTGSSGIKHFLHEVMTNDGSHSECSMYREHTVNFNLENASRSTRVMSYSNVECATTMTTVHSELPGTYACNDVMDIDDVHVPRLNQQSFERISLGHLRRCFIPDNFGGPNSTCPYCGAYMWYEERIDVSRMTSSPTFFLCCRKGMIKLPPPKPTPPFLDTLLDYRGGRRSTNFRKKLRLYNSLFQFTSLRGKIDDAVNDRAGPYVFKLGGQNHHRIGSLLPISGCRPRFSQLYIYDTDNEVSNRMSSLNCDHPSYTVDSDIVEGLIRMLDESNEIVKAFRTSRYRFRNSDYIPMHLRLIGSRNSLDRNYNAPTVPKIAGLIVGDIGEYDRQRDIIVEHRNEEDGFRLGIHYVESPRRKRIKRESVTMREYFAYLIQQRFLEHNTLLRGGRLFQQFLVDAFTSVEEMRLQYIKDNQKHLRSKIYKGIRDAMTRGDERADEIGKRIVLPVSFTGGPRYLFQNYQDAMAICRYYGFPDLFITFACNAKWFEIEETLSSIPGQRAEDRPDIVAKVFRIKVRHLMKKKHFGTAVAITYTIEFQKRGLPHVHILLWLSPQDKCSTIAHIDRIISAEIPDRDLDPCGYDAVTSFMMHGLCGIANNQAPCMIKGKCIKFFPKQFQNQSEIREDGFPIYRRRDKGFVAIKNGIELDNRFVVPRNVDLVVKYQSHINVEVCSQTKAIKYLFKYVNKGNDRARVVLQSENGDVENRQTRSFDIDEIKMYLDCRYLSAYEACWRLFEFAIHHREPAVQRLVIHLPAQHNVYFSDNEIIAGIMHRPDIEKTMFTEWMVANREHQSARNLIYADF